MAPRGPGRGVRALGVISISLGHRQPILYVRESYQDLAELQRPSTSVCKDCYNKVPHSGWLKEQKFISSQFWMAEVQD